MSERLYRTVEDRMLLGVLGGIALRLDVDPSLTRVVYVIALLITGFFPLLIVYIVAAIIIPQAPPGYEAWARATRRSWGGGSPGPTGPYGTGAPGQGAWPTPPPDASGASGPGPADPLWTAPAPPAWPAAGTDAAPPGAAPWAAGTGAAAGGAAPFAPAAGPPGAGSAADGGGSAAGPGPGWGSGWQAPSAPGPAPRQGSDPRRAALIGGLVLVVLGTLFLVGQLAPDIDWSLVWPAAFIAIGVLLVLGAIRRT